MRSAALFVLFSVLAAEAWAADISRRYWPVLLVLLGFVFTVALLVFVIGFRRRCPKCHRFFALEALKGEKYRICKYCSRLVFNQRWDFDNYFPD